MIAAIRDNHPYEMPGIDVFDLVRFDGTTASLPNLTMAASRAAMAKCGSEVLLGYQRDDLLETALIERAEIANLVAVDVEHEFRLASRYQRHDDFRFRQRAARDVAGKGSTSSTITVFWSVAAAPHTPLSNGMLTQASGPWNGPSINSFGRGRAVESDPVEIERLFQDRGDVGEIGDEVVHTAITASIWGRMAR